jgi:P27 family predicted phage terminase small subunit
MSDLDKLLMETRELDKQVDRMLEGTEPVGPPPDPPAHLDEVAAAKWVEIASEIHGRDQGTLDLVALYATEWARWRHAESEVAKIGEVVRSPQGYPQANPWLSISRQAFDRLVKLSKRLGIDPQ